MLCIMLETELGHPACLSGFCKCLIIPLGWVVNENSNTSSLFQIGEMGDVIRYLCSNSVYLEACTKPCFFKHKRNQKKKKKSSFSYPLLQMSFGQHPNSKLMPVFCQNHTIIRLCSNFLLLLGALLFPLHLSFFFSPTATNMLTTPLKQHSAQALRCRAAESLKNTQSAFCGEWGGGQWHMLNAPYRLLKWKMPLNYLFHKSLGQL